MNKAQERPAAGEPPGTLPTTRDTGGDRFDLKDFFPYRVAVLADRVSEAVSQVYSGRYDLGRAEWRVLAALGVNERMTAREIAPYSTLDKMQVSRAVARLEENGLLRRAEDAADRRAQILSLTAAGRSLFRRIVPLVLAREAYILEVLDADEQAVLDRALTKITARAEELVRRG